MLKNRSYGLYLLVLKSLLSVLFLINGSYLFSQNNGFGTLQPFSPESGECLSDEKRSEIFIELENSRKELYQCGKLLAPQPDQITLLDWPMRLRSGLNQYGYHSISGGVDHNPAYPNQLLDYNCGTRTYDTPSGYNHAGTDFFLWPFSWNKMDSLDVEVIAAAPGTIIYKSDGNFDRSCGFNNNNWNAIYIQHADGSVAWYGHMKNGSLTSKIPGQTVVAGEYLGVVGSSGNSTGPHLHLELYDAANNLLDPFQGSCNSMNAQSWWINQRLYVDRAINHIQTNNAPPVFTACSNQDVKNEWDLFIGTDTIYLMTYYRFLQNSDNVQITIYQPDNSIWSSWPWTNTWGDFNAAYVYWWMIAGSGAMQGQWKFEAIYNNQTYIDYFWIGTSGLIEENGSSQKDLLLNIYSIDGRLLKTLHNCSTDPMTIIPEFPAGLYIWNLLDNGTPVSSGKLMKVN